jgi:hypothetical protein
MEGMWGGKTPAPDKYLDLSYFENAAADVIKTTLQTAKTAIK